MFRIGNNKIRYYDTNEVQNNSKTEGPKKENLVSSLFSSIVFFIGKNLNVKSMRERVVSPSREQTISFKVLEASKNPAYNGLIHEWNQSKFGGKEVSLTEKTLLADLFTMADRGEINTKKYREAMRQLPLEIAEKFLETKDLDRRIDDGKVEYKPIQRSENIPINPSLHSSKFAELFLDMTIEKGRPLTHSEKNDLANTIFNEELISKENPTQAK